MSAPYDSIYLGPQEHPSIPDSREWCEDDPWGDGTRYLLATPVRDAADDLLAALRIASVAFDGYEQAGIMVPRDEARDKIRAAIARAEGGAE